MAQTAAVLVVQDRRTVPDAIHRVLLSRFVHNARSKRPVVPGDQLRDASRDRPHDARHWKITKGRGARSTVKLAAEARLMRAKRDL